MFDFVKISVRSPKKDVYEIYPKFLMKRSEDLMIRGGDFYAVWIEDRGLWSTDEYDVIHIIDQALSDEYERLKDNYPKLTVKYMYDADSGSIDRWHKYCQKQLRDSFTTLDETLIFSNSEVSKKDYASKKLSYPIEKGDISAWDKLVGTLYSDEERHKIEWAIGAIVTGDSKTIQKFMVLYGAAGTGKSTILDIVQQLFEGYCAVFDAKALGSANSPFSLEAFRSNPLVAIQHDGDLSKIEDNTRLNSLVSHELMTVNEKFKSTYENRFKAFLMIGTNKPVRITDGKSGLLRRLIDVRPSGNKLSLREYNKMKKQVGYELGAIAYHCREVYLDDPGCYDDYVPTEMMGATNDFYNFVIDSFHIFKKNDGTTLKAAWEMYKTYCEEAKVQYPYSRRNFKEELKNYFYEFEENFNMEDGSRVRSYYSGFRNDKFGPEKPKKTKTVKTDKTTPDWLVMKDADGDNVLNLYLANCPAQYANEEGTPYKKWTNVTTKLSDIDPSAIHYVMGPENLVTIDFDLKDAEGNKSFDLNAKAASEWPVTYAELSKSGQGIHLEYIYGGDASKLSNIFSEDIEIKTFKGNSSLRRKLTKCNNLPIATISSGLPVKGDRKMVNWDGLANEKALRTIIKKNLNKEYHGNTKPSVDYIYKTLEDAYDSGMKYDVSDMENAVIAFAAGSTNQANACLKLVGQMHFKSDEPSANSDDKNAALIFFDTEVFPNLFIVNWKFSGEGKSVVRMINPSSEDIESLLQNRLVGFNCRRYDNHLLYARLLGYDNRQLFELSQKIVNSKKGENRSIFFGEAYNLSYTDVYDFAAKKQSLKKWEIELGLKHHELGLPWDQPVPESRWTEVAEYCDDDVLATEAVFYHLKGDWEARQILAALAGMTVNDTTNTLTARIIFGSERHPALVYTDLATGERTDGTRDIASFRGYEYDAGKNMYRGIDVGRGGYVYAEPGMYYNVALLDIQSMHPNSAIQLNAFGEYTENFKNILDARVAIKHGELDKVKKMFGGRLAPYLDDPDSASALAQALKIAINSVYGLTSASFDNPFRDIRNKNNIVALRGALFMKTLQDEVVKRGYSVVHIKTDSIKIPEADPEIIGFCMDFAKQYGYTFEHEATYDRMCLVNDAVYIAKYKSADVCKRFYGYVPDENKKKGGQWTATGKQFAVPYVFKSLFTKEPVTINDMREVFSVKTALYLDMNERLPDVSEYEKELRKLETDRKKGKVPDDIFEGESERLKALIEKGHNYRFIGKVGEFSPVISGVGGGVLCRQQDEKYYAPSGTTGYRWLEAEKFTAYNGNKVTSIDAETGENTEIAEVELIPGNSEEIIDKSYYRKLADDAIDAIDKYGDFEQFVNGEEKKDLLPMIYNHMSVPLDADEEIPWEEYVKERSA